MPAQNGSQVVVRGKAALRLSFELEDAASAPSVELYFGSTRWPGGAPDQDHAGQGLGRLHPLRRAGAGRVRQELETGRFRSNVFCRLFCRPALQ
jgi:hypothetical protein